MISTYQIAGRPAFPIITNFLAYAIERQTMTTNPRPTRLTDAMKLAAATDLVADMIKSHDLEENQRDGAVRDIVQHATAHMDGYELAKVLDDRCMWSCDLGMAEALDGYSAAARKQLEIAQKAWFETEQPAQPAEAGQRIAFKWGGQQHTGTVGEVWAHGVAQFAVKVDGDDMADASSQRRAIVDWEDCRLLPKDVAA